MSNQLDPEILRFEASDFADWLRGGLLTYSGAKKLPSRMRLPDAFPYAQLFIGRNEHDVVEDLKDVHQALPPAARVAFQRGVVRAWAELEFREDFELNFGEQILTLACRVRAKGIVDSLANALPWLAAAGDETDLSEGGKARFRAVLSVRKRAFQAAIELAASSTESVQAIETFFTDDPFNEPLLERAQALEMVCYLALNARDRIAYWCAIFGNHIVVDMDDGVISEDAARDRLERAYSVESLQRVIDMVRIDKVARLATERGQLSELSMDGLFNLVSRIDSINAGGGYVRQPVTLGWSQNLERPATASADVIDMLEWKAS
jgi:hypothetical protein